MSGSFLFNKQPVPVNVAVTLFSTGRYLDRIDLRGAEPLFEERLVVFDNKRVDTLLAIPL